SRMAEELGDDVLVALKILPPRVAREQERMLLRFRREIDLSMRTNHPNVTRTLSGGEIEGLNYLAMEHLPGKTGARIARRGRRPAERPRLARLRALLRPDRHAAVPRGHVEGQDPPPADDRPGPADRHEPGGAGEARPRRRPADGEAPGRPPGLRDRGARLAPP